MDSASILVVEDDPSVRAFVAAVLASAGYAVHAVATMEEAKTLAADARTLDLLVSDVVLGPTDGLDVEEAVRIWHPTVKTLFMSGYAAFRDRTGLEDPLLMKPFKADELLERVGLLLAAA